jgi:hypothetical protein
MDVSETKLELSRLTGLPIAKSAITFTSKIYVRFLGEPRKIGMDHKHEYAKYNKCTSPFAIAPIEFQSFLLENIRWIYMYEYILREFDITSDVCDKCDIFMVFFLNNMICR